MGLGVKMAGKRLRVALGSSERVETGSQGAGRRNWGLPPPGPRRAPAQAPLPACTSARQTQPSHRRSAVRGGQGCMAAAPAGRPGAAQGDAALVPGGRWRSHSGPRPGRPAPPRAACMSALRTATPARRRRRQWRRRQPRPRRTLGGRGAPAAGRGAGWSEGGGPRAPPPTPIPTRPAAGSAGLDNWPLPPYRWCRSANGALCAPPARPQPRCPSPPTEPGPGPHLSSLPREKENKCYGDASLCLFHPSVLGILTPPSTPDPRGRGRGGAGVS